MSSAVTAVIARPARPTEMAGPGRTRITSRALNRVVSAVTAEELGVDARKVSVELEDHGGALALTVRAPIHVISLVRAMDDPSSIARAGGSVLDRAAQAQENIRSRVQLMTGSSISRVVLRITSAEIKQERRVR